MNPTPPIDRKDAKPPDHVIEEARYRREERLGILCGTNAPTKEEQRLGDAEYFSTIARWRAGRMN